MKYNWEDLPERKNLFTVKNTVMKNLNTGKPIQHYATNTKIAVVQKCVTPEKTYYRTQEAAHHCLNYAFEAEAFGLPNELAPSAHSSKPNSLEKHTTYPQSAEHPSHRSTVTQKSIQNAAVPKGGEEKQQRSWLKRLFRRKNG